MKLDGMKCPHCGSNNTHAWQIEKASLWDDGFYKTMKVEFENPLLSSSTENVVYKCVCNDCKKHFGAMVILDVKVKGTICKVTTEEIMQLKESEVNNASKN